MPTGYAGTSPVGKPREAPEKSECLGSGGSTVARLKLKGIDGRAPPGVEPAAQFDSTRGSLPGPDTVWIDRLRLFHDPVGGGAWPLLARGAIRLVHSDNGRDSALADNKRRSKGARLTGEVGVRAFGSGRRSSHSGRGAASDRRRAGRVLQGLTSSSAYEREP